MQTSGLIIPVVAILLAVGVTSYVVHMRSYDALYRALRSRAAVGDDFRPDWTTRISAWGCMGFVTRLRREIGTEGLSVHERRMLRRVTRSYHLGVPAVFVLTCILAWLLYSQAR